MLNMKKTLTKILDALKVDYVVEQGTSGIWTYRKWNSGIAECWGSNQTSATFSSWGNIYSVDISGISYPSGLFNATPICNVYTSCQGGNSVGSVNSNTGSSTTTPSLTAIRGTNLSGSQTFITKYYAIGKWK